MRNIMKRSKYSLGRPNLDGILDGDYIPLDYQAFAASQSITLIKRPEGDRGIPAVVFSWVPKHFLSLTSEEMKQLEGKFEPSLFSLGSEGTYNTWLAPLARDGQPDLNEVTLMNFRRYGWSCAPGFNAEHGYATGIIYANGEAGGLLCANEQEVIRDALVRTLHLMVSKEKVPGELVYSREAERVLTFLLEDAYKHATDHARTPCLRDTESLRPIKCQEMTLPHQER